jgi:hypothetical protein
MWRAGPCRGNLYTGEVYTNEVLMIARVDEITKDDVANVKLVRYIGNAPSFISDIFLGRSARPHKPAIVYCILYNA